jgi:hypothetical protein
MSGQVGRYILIVLQILASISSLAENDRMRDYKKTDFEMEWIYFHALGLV